MPYNEKMLNRQIGRNAQLFAQVVSTLDTPEARYPYLRILVNVIEGVRPEWVQVEQKAQLFTHLINEMTETSIDADEIARVVAMRDAERTFLQKIAAGKVPAKPAKTNGQEASAAHEASEAQTDSAPDTAPDATDDASRGDRHEASAESA